MKVVGAGSVPVMLSVFEVLSWALIAAPPIEPEERDSRANVQDVIVDCVAPAILIIGLWSVTGEVEEEEMLTEESEKDPPEARKRGTARMLTPSEVMMNSILLTLSSCAVVENTAFPLTVETVFLEDVNGGAAVIRKLEDASLKTIGSSSAECSPWKR